MDPNQPHGPYFGPGVGTSSSSADATTNTQHPDFPTMRRSATARHNLFASPAAQASQPGNPAPFPSHQLNVNPGPSQPPHTLPHLPIPTIAEIKGAIPPWGITALDLTKVFRRRIGRGGAETPRVQAFIANVRAACWVHQETKLLFPRPRPRGEGEGEGGGGGGGGGVGVEGGVSLAFRGGRGDGSGGDRRAG